MNLNVNRREAMGALGAGTLALSGTALGAGTRAAMAMHGSNPVANADQLAAEDLVRRLWRQDSIGKAREIVASNFAIAHGAQVPAEAKAGFAGAMDEFVTNYLFKAAAYDPDRPRLVRLFMPAYSWFGHDVPGARMGGDNPDNVYRVAGIGHGRSYRLTGRTIGLAAPSISFTLVANWGTSMTVQTLMHDELERAADGSFTITIGPEPAAGRRNHMQTSPDVRFLFVRDSLSDWAAQTPLDLRIACLNPSGERPLALAALAEEAARRMIEEVPLYFWFARMFSALAPNVVSPPTGQAAFGGLVRQTSGRAMLSLAPGEGFLVTFDPAGAGYSALALHDWWFRSIDAHQRLSSTTSDMARRNPDGTVTCVVAPEDPGVANWVDTGGLRNVQLLCRWQGMKDKLPTMTGRVVRLAEIGGLLPAVTPAERIRDVAARQAAFARRVQA